VVEEYVGAVAQEVRTSELVVGKVRLELDGLTGKVVVKEGQEGKSGVEREIAAALVYPGGDVAVYNVARDGVARLPSNAALDNASHHANDVVATAAAPRKIVRIGPSRLLPLPPNVPTGSDGLPFPHAWLRSVRPRGPLTPAPASSLDPPTSLWPEADPKDASGNGATATAEGGGGSTMVIPGTIQRGTAGSGIGSARGAPQPDGALASGSLPVDAALGPVFAGLPPVHSLLGVGDNESGYLGDPRTPGTAVGERLATQLRLTATLVQLGHAPMEPSYVTAFLFDTKRRVKLSENWHVDTNEGSVMALLAGVKRDRDALARCRSALFGVHYLSPDVTLVVLVYVTLSPHECPADAVYMKGSLSDKQKVKAAQELSENVARNGRSLALLGVGEAALFGSDGELLADKLSVSLARPKANEELRTTLADLSAKRLKVIPGASVRMSAATLGVGQQLPGLVSPTLVRLTPLPDPQPPAASLHDHLVREVAPLKPADVAPAPHATYNNALLVTLEGANLSSAKDSSSRSFCVQVKLMANDSNPRAAGERVVYGNSTGTAMRTAGVSAVAYRQKKPRFGDEFKIDLPLELTDKHHLLFAIYHIQVDAKKKLLGSSNSAAASAEALAAALGEDEAETVRGDLIGFATLPLLRRDGPLAGLPAFCAAPDESHDAVPFSLTVATSLPGSLASGYLDPEVQANLKLLDKKPVFNVSLRLASSIYSSCPTVQHFFAEYSLARRAGGTERDVHLRGVIGSLPREAAPHQLVAFFPVLMRHALFLLEYYSDGTAQAAIQFIAETVVRVRESFSDTDFIQGWLTYGLDHPRIKDDTLPTPSAPLHERILSAWLGSLDPDESVRHVLGASDVLFTLLLKILAISLHRRKLLADDDNRPARTSARFVSDLAKLVRSLGAHVRSLHAGADAVLDAKAGSTRGTAGDKPVTAGSNTVSRARKDRRLANTTARAISLFFKDALHLLDRGVLFGIIDDHLTDLDPSNSTKRGVMLKVNALADLATHDRWLQLNFASPSIVELSSGVASLPADWRAQHFLVGSLFRLLARLFASRANEMRGAIVRICRIVRFCLAAHDADWALLMENAAAGDKGSCTLTPKQAQQLYGIAVSLYLPYVTILADNVRYVEKWKTYQQRIALVPFCEILAALPERLLARWHAAEAPARRVGVWQVLLLGRPAFEYVGAAVIRRLSRLRQLDLEASNALARTGGGTTSKYRTQMGELRRLNAMSGNRARPTGGGVSVPPSSSATRHATFKGGLAAHERLAARDALAATDEEPSDSPEIELEREQLLAQYGAATVLSVGLRLLESPFGRDVNTASSEVAAVALQSLANALQVPPTKELAHALFVCWRHVLEVAPLAIFKARNGVLGDLAYYCLRWAEETEHPTLRAQAEGVLLGILVAAKRPTGNFSRVRLQLSIAISQLAGERGRQRLSDLTSGQQVTLEARYPADFFAMQGALQVVRDAAASQVSADAAAVVDRLFSVMEYQSKLQASAWDPDTMADLYYTLADSFSDSPDLKITWLNNLAGFHLERKEYEEAVQTKLLIAAYIATYLRLIGRWDSVAVRLGAWAKVFPSIEAEVRTPTAVAMQAMAADVCQSSLFSVQGFLQLLRQVVVILREGQLYESAVEVFKLMLPLHEASRDYLEQAEAHGAVARLCDQIVAEEEAGTRLFSNFYVIRFDGEKLGPDQHQKTFVYREPGFLRIAELSTKFRERYLRRYSEVEVYSSHTPKKDMDTKNKVYIQIFAVKPLLSAVGGEQGVSKSLAALQARSLNVDRFYYESPFVAPGGDSADVSAVGKKRTILTTRATFPYLFKRLPVAKKEEVEMSPIQTSTDLIVEKCAELTKELDSSAPRSNVIQQLLQGSLLTQVNAGPTAIAKVFLGGGSALYPADDVGKLRTTMLQFTEALKRAVAWNKTYIDATQLEFQTMLEESLASFTTMVEELAGVDELDDE